MARYPHTADRSSCRTRATLGVLLLAATLLTGCGEESEGSTPSLQRPATPGNSSGGISQPPPVNPPDPGIGAGGGGVNNPGAGINPGDDDDPGSGGSASSVTLSWLPPTDRADGSPLYDLAEYRIYYGNSPAELTHTIVLDNPGLSAYVIEPLEPGAWYFTMTAVDSMGLESMPTDVVYTQLH